MKERKKNYIYILGLAPGLPRKVIKLHPMALLPVCPLKGDYLYSGLSMMTDMKIRSFLIG